MNEDTEKKRADAHSSISAVVNVLAFQGCIPATILEALSVATVRVWKKTRLQNISKEEAKADFMSVFSGIYDSVESEGGDTN